jgi:predicted dehydrogenase
VSSPPVARRRLLLCGAGRVVERYYGPALLRSPYLRVGAIIDPSEQQRAWASSAFSAPAYITLDEALAAGEYDAGLVVSPPDSQPETVQALLARRLPVLVEKPGARSMAEAQTLLEAAQGLVLRMALVRRYWRRYERLQRRLDAEPERWSIEIETDPAAWGHVDRTQTEGIDGLLYDLLPHAYDIATSTLGADISALIGSACELGRVHLWFDSAATRTITIRHGSTYVERVTASAQGRTFTSEPSQIESVVERALIRARLQRREQEVAFDRLLASFAADLNAGKTNDDLLSCAALIESVRALAGDG